ncbi:hypothetical protein TNCV_2085691 [Trichonephila clavipes]|nr:hypothetical protein TNCV_2085691 [Trichonephila clavipes]
MFCTWSDYRGIIYKECLEKGKTINSKFLINGSRCPENSPQTVHSPSKEYIKKAQRTAFTVHENNDNAGHSNVQSAYRGSLQHAMEECTRRSSALFTQVQTTSRRPFMMPLGFDAPIP